LYIGIDIGTSGVKGVLLNENGDELFQCRNEYEYSLEDGRAEQEPDEVFDAFIQTVHSVFSASPSTPLALGLSAAMHSVFPVDAQGIPLTKAVLWMDVRSEPQVEQVIRKKEEVNLWNATGTPVHPMTPLYKIMWFKENNPEIYQKAFKWVSIKEYIVFRLTGEWRIDYSMASASGLFNPRELQWNTQALQLCGIGAENLSELTNPLTQIKVHHPLFPEKTAWFLGSTDGCMANIGSGGIGEEDLIVTIGSSAAIRAITKNFSPKEKALFSYMIIPGEFITGGASNYGATIIDWAKNNLFEGIHDFQNLEEKINQSVPGAEGLIFLPYLFGERAPLWDANAKSEFCFQKNTHSKEDMLRASLEGMLFNIRCIMDRVESITEKKKNILVNGGVSNSAIAMQIFSDMLSREIKVMNEVDSSSLGAGLLAMRAFNRSNSWFKKNVHFVVYQPNKKNERIYSESYKKFLEILEEKYFKDKLIRVIN